MDIPSTALSRRRFLQTSGTAGALGTVGLGGDAVTTPLEAEAQAAETPAETEITKSMCHRRPARCGSCC